MNPEAIDTLFTSFMTDITSILTTNLSKILLVVAALIGLGFLIVRVKKWIGKKA